MKNIFAVIVLLFVISIGLVRAEDAPPFFYDAIVFKGSDSLARIDVYAMTPYQTLQFNKSGDKYFAKYQFDISITDSLGNKVAGDSKERTLFANSYYIAKGGEGDYDAFQTSLFLPSGNYKIRVVLSDVYSKKDYERSKAISVLNYGIYNFSLSGILLLSSIEEKNGGGYIITPHFSDNVGSLKDGFFAFFEKYDKIKDSVNIDYQYELTDSKGASIFKSDLIKKGLDTNTQTFIKVKLPKSFPAGSFNLRITALKGDRIIAASERTCSYQKTLLGKDIANLDKMIKQLAYVASQSEMDYIKAGETLEDRADRFEEFWQKLDPTIGTPRNEAFEDYYSRIDYANKKFKTYSEGWQTDMGKVFVLYGMPNNAERKDNGFGRIYEIWYYGDGRQFVFVDDSGLGDFKITTLLPAGEKYKYKAPSEQ